MAQIKSECEEIVRDKTDRPTVVRNATDLQRLKLEKLMKNPHILKDKPIIIPEKPKERGMPAVPEFVRNVMGSSAGAGSGEFHVYRHLRRKEYARQKFMKERGERERLEDEYHDKLEENKRKAEEKTAKKRAKRLKRKGKMKNKTKTLKADESSSESEEESNSDSEKEVETENKGEGIKAEKEVKTENKGEDIKAEKEVDETKKNSSEEDEQTTVTEYNESNLPDETEDTDT